MELNSRKLSQYITVPRPSSDMYLGDFQRELKIHKYTKIELRKSRCPRHTINKDSKRHLSFPDKYGSPQGALSEAAYCMQWLNKEIKTMSHQPNAVEYVYWLKGQLTKLLYEKQYCISLSESERINKLTGRSVTYISFVFEVNGNRFLWHIPKQKTPFNYNIILASNIFMPKQSHYSPSERDMSSSECKSLIRWVLSQWHGSPQDNVSAA